MAPVGPFPRLLLGTDSLSQLPAELAALGVDRPLLLSDRGLEQAGAVGTALAVLPDGVATFLDVPENPTVAGADAAFAVYRAGGCDGVVGLGGGSVLDIAKIVAALAGSAVGGAVALLGRPDLLPLRPAPLVAIPTTVGTGSESSPVSALHTHAGGPVIGTRGSALVPRVAICDPALARTLPRRLVAATAIDALSHCVEGFFAEPANAMVDALALDGVRRVLTDLLPALEPGGEAARESLMAAAFAGGVAIHKGLGLAHAVALACADQDVHHGTLIAIALPVTVPLVAARVPDKAARLAAAAGLATGEALAPAFRRLAREAGLPTSLREAGYRIADAGNLVATMAGSHFNRTSPFVPGVAEYARVLETIAG